MYCWLFTLSGLKILLSLVKLYGGSVTIVGYYWKQNGVKLAKSHKWEGWFLYSIKQMFRLANLLMRKILIMGSKW